MATRRRSRRNPRRNPPGLAAIDTDLHNRGMSASTNQRIYRLETAVMQTQKVVMKHDADLKDIFADLGAINTFQKNVADMLNKLEAKLKGK